MTLRECFNRHTGRLVGKIDHFFDVYEPHFSRYRNSPVRLLEIGVDRGGSLELWRNYFGSEAVIHGIDINPKAIELAPDDAVIHVGSQDDTDFLESVITGFGPFDIVIDDGSHLMEHQIKTFQTIYPRIHDHGLYVCEDACTSYWREYGGRLGGPGTFMEYAKQLIDELHAYWAVDDDLEPTSFTKTTQGIHFYSGTVVFQRHPVEKPVYTVKHKSSLSEMSIADLKIAVEKQAQLRD